MMAAPRRVKMKGVATPGTLAQIDGCREPEHRRRPGGTGEDLANVPCPGYDDVLIPACEATALLVGLAAGYLRR